MPRLHKFLFQFLVLFSISLPSYSSESQSDLSVFAEYADKNTIDISYTDLSHILNRLVLDVGISDRSRAKTPKPPIGRRTVKGNKSSVRFEGNRLNFPVLEKPENIKALSIIRRELEAMPDAVPMKLWTKNQQLAYWLNLYNVTMMEQLTLDYPIKKLKKRLYGKNNLLDKKLLKVAGVDLSLNDIHHEILIKNWQDPLIMYGLFHGYISSANLRKQAYAHQTVYSQLRENAMEFINSNRGMRASGNSVILAELYDVNAKLFPGWDASLKKHLVKYASATYQGRINGARNIKADTADYYIADVFQGIRNDTNPNAGNNAVLGQLGDASFQDWISSKTVPLAAFGVPSHVMEYLMKIREKRMKQQGFVDVEEVTEK